MREIERADDDGHIRVRGARVHNLRGVDVDIPRDRLVVLTGVSGSGKSTLAFDTIFAEGQRRYIEGLSTYARQFLDQLERPDVDAIDGLPPTVAIDQRSGAVGPRSTVATVTEAYDYLRLLYARAGTPHCPKCGKPIRRQTPEQMVASVLALGDGKKVILLAPIVRGRKGLHADAFAAIRRAGLLRARVDGETIEIGPDDPKLAKTKVHTIEAVVDRLVVREGIRPRLAESLDLALKLGEGSLVLSIAAGDGWDDRTLSVKFACPECNVGLGEVEPRTFSFNSPLGACPTCDGLGTREDGSTCPTCRGARLRPEALAVTIDGRNIHEVSALAVDDARRFLATQRFDPPYDRVGPPLIVEIDRRLEFLERVGLGYLTLGRSAATLSGGEYQRVRLATQIGSGLTGACYVLDEPTAGLHPRDTDRLIASLIDLRDRGNTVLVVEHDEAVIRAADRVIDLGPGAGPFGGRIIAEGPPDALVEAEPGLSLTLRHLANPTAIGALRTANPDAWIGIRGAAEHNLKGIDVRIPVGTLTCVAGVSGSGKSTLILDILAKAARRHLDGAGPEPGRHEGIDGLDRVDKQIVIDPSPIGRTPRSTPSTATGVFDAIRKVFAGTREAKVRGYGPSRFSFNVKGGRCEPCKGQGVRTIEMKFLPDLEVICESCRGGRFNPGTLAVLYKGKSIADVLAMRVDEARDFFEAVPFVLRGLNALHDAGLGYLTLGQPASTLSGGEAQRVKLAAELARPGTGRTLYILDEPTAGLHFADVANLIGVLRRLADLGNTVVVIEHNPDVLKESDWIVELGPEGGAGGGQLLAAGSPAAIVNDPSSVTGPYLR